MNDPTLPPAPLPGSTSGVPFAGNPESSISPAIVLPTATQPHSPEQPDQAAQPVPSHGTDLGRLLAGLREAAPAASSIVDQTNHSQQSTDVRFENRLAVVRLGMATSLYYSLRTKHAPTAGHCLRVALSCSAWAQRLGLDEATRDRIEVAALLHDLGKIGIPDRILRKPGKLSVDEQLTMELTPELGCEILRGCTSDQDLLDIIRYASTWYESRRHGDGPSGDAIPLGSRMLAIADAFDAMTTDTVYRPALSRERATGELLRNAGVQFDPELAMDFNRMLEQRPEMLQRGVVDRWLHQLQDKADGHLLGSPLVPAGVHGDLDCSSSPQTHGTANSTTEQSRREIMFYQQLVGTLKDGVAFTDGEGTITHWNDAMQRLTGVATDAIIGQSWDGESLGMRSKDPRDGETACPVFQSLAQNSATSRSMLIQQNKSEPTPVQLQVWPVAGSAPGSLGAVVVLRDLSDQATLEEKLETLHLKTTMDALTNVANRAHFDSKLSELSTAAAKGGASFSLIICDIDHFKRVNDVHGHPAGDEALISFAGVLKAHSRDGDTVARYGGEEFLLLSPNCDNATATRRAEAIRVALEGTPLPSLGNESVTASFGVTEFQAGDRAETILARADRALLKAKDNGRNRVIQLGAGATAESPESLAANPGAGWLSWLTGSKPKINGEFDIVTPVPVDLTIEKLRGFIADHNAEIISVDENQVSMKLNVMYSRGGRRRADQQMSIRMQLTLSERRAESKQRHLGVKTNVHVNLTPIRNRDRRGQEVKACYSQVLNSLKSYLMGELRANDAE